MLRCTARPELTRQLDRCGDRQRGERDRGRRAARGALSSTTPIGITWHRGRPSRGPRSTAARGVAVQQGLSPHEGRVPDHPNPAMRDTPMFASRAVGGLFTLGALALSLATAMGADQKPDRGNAAERGEGVRKGAVTGVVTAKGENWIAVRGDGEERARRYLPHWRGGAPAAGGGLDKEMVARIGEIPVHSRVKLDWAFEEGPRVEKIEVLG